MTRDQHRSSTKITKFSVNQLNQAKKSMESVSNKFYVYNTCPKWIFGNNTNGNYQQNVNVILVAYKSFGVRKSLKIDFLYSRLSFFPEFLSVTNRTNDYTKLFDQWNLAIQDYRILEEIKYHSSSRKNIGFN